MFDFADKYKISIRAGVIALAFFILLFWIKDFLSGEEGRVRRFIFKGKQAVERENILACSSLISMDYSDKYGFDRASLIYGLKEGFQYYLKIAISIESIKINLDAAKEKADVEITALVIGQPKDRVLEKILEGEKGKFKVKLIKEESGWKALSLEFYEPVSIMGQEII